jgi:hypothetical protein
VRSEAVLYRQSRSVLWRNVGNDVLLATPDGDEFDQLSETGSTVWRLLDQPLSLTELVSLLSDAYGEAPQRIASDVQPLLTNLIELGSIEVVEDGR